MPSLPKSLALFAFSVLAAGIAQGQVDSSHGDTSKITSQMVSGMEDVLGLHFSGAKVDSMLDGLKDQRTNFENVRKFKLQNSVPPAILFNPIPNGFHIDSRKGKFKASKLAGVKLPDNLEDAAFYSVGQLAELIRTRKVTSEQLTRMYITRMQRYAPMLHCLITLTEERALEQAKKADKEIAAGKYRGPLHGIPYGAKDLLAAPGYKTTWGSAVYKDQQLEDESTVIKRLDDAGAVLIAKLSMGELAMGDVWYDGTTRNPWDTSKGSSGSSAGSASAIAAGLAAFTIGTETWGSIVSPSTVCGTTGLRPTYGRVSRYGAMALSWSMDKIGPICRTVEDCALVFNAIIGPDGKDQTLYDASFNYDPGINIKKLRVGYLKDDFDSVKNNQALNDTALAVLRSMGVELIPVRLPKYPTYDLSIILTAEAGAAFDDLTRSGKDDRMVQQTKDAWPNIFRSAHFIPAVDYINANRIRSLLIQDMGRMMDSLDLYVAPPFEGDNLLLTNLTSNPCVVLPNGFTDKGLPTSITFIGRLFDEARVLAFAKKYQDATTFHLKHPKMFSSAN